MALATTAKVDGRGDDAGHDVFEQKPRLWPLMADFLAGRAVPAQALSRAAIDVVPARR